MKTFSVYEKNTNNLLIRVNCYDRKIYRMMLRQFIKIKQVYVKED